jgi:hypothetical protein
LGQIGCGFDFDILGLLKECFEVEVAFGFFDGFEKSHFGELLFSENIREGLGVVGLRSVKALNEVIVMVGFWDVFAWGLVLSVGGAVILE